MKSILIMKICSCRTWSCLSSWLRRGGGFCRMVMMSTRFFLRLISRLVSPCLFLDSLSQPDSSRILVNFLRPMAAAMCNAVSPFWNKLHEMMTMMLKTCSEKTLHEIGGGKIGLEDKCGRSIKKKMTKCLLVHLPAWEMIQLSWAVWGKCEMKMQTNLKDILHKTCANIINAFDRVHLPYMWKSALEISLRSMIWRRRC